MYWLVIMSQLFRLVKELIVTNAKTVNTEALTQLLQLRSGIVFHNRNEAEIVDKVNNCT